MGIFRIALLIGACCVTTFARAEAPRVLLIGDSQSVGTFGRRLPGVLMKQGRAQVAVVARCGATPAHFFEEGYSNCGFYERSRNGVTLGPGTGHRPVERLVRLLDRERPDVLIVQLGGNSVPLSQSHWERHVRLVMDALRERERIQCLWVGPPPGWGRDPERFKSYYDFMSQHLGTRCRFFDSRPGIQYPEQTGDGIHLDRISSTDLHRKYGCALDGSDARTRPECLSGAQRAAKWAERVATWYFQSAPSLSLTASAAAEMH